MVPDKNDVLYGSLGMLVLQTLAPGVKRFTVVKREIGDISQRMLAQTLRRLEQDGLVSRTVHPTIPPRVDYALTPIGLSFMEPLDSLVAWAEANGPRIRAIRAAVRPSADIAATGP